MHTYGTPPDRMACPNLAWILLEVGLSIQACSETGLYSQKQIESFPTSPLTPNSDSWNHSKPLTQRSQFRISSKSCHTIRSPTAY